MSQPYMDVHNKFLSTRIEVAGSKAYCNTNVMAIEDWEQYPGSLPVSTCDPYTYDVTFLSEALRREAGRLFTTNDRLRLKVIESGHRNYNLQSVSELEEYLRGSKFRGTRVVLVPQEYSWGSLLISEEGFRKLVSYFEVFPPFLDVVHAFGRRTTPASDSIGGFQSHCSTGSTSVEHCYLLKHAEEHGRDEQDDPWSIRQMGVYHRRGENEDDLFIIINPSKSFQRRLKDAQTNSGLQPGPKDIQTLLLSCTTLGWRWHVNYVEGQFNDLKTKAHLAAVSEKERQHNDVSLEIEFSDTQDLQVIQDKLHKLSYILEMNFAAFRGVVSSISVTNSGENKESANLEKSRSEMEVCATETVLQKRRVDMMLHRLQATSGLMQNIVALRGLDALQIGSNMTIKIMSLAQSDNQLMVDLTKKAHKDAKTLKTITILTMIFLPASFVSQFLSMGYIKIQNGNNHVALHFANEMWIFGILTAILLVLVIGLWLFVEQRRRKRARLSHPIEDQAELGLIKKS
ncbi:hypothetical protein AOQ84DRAFT_385717 [Glonium stellatum]|uniref:CorA-like transporter domain-containing protein n=1 Tax=Glonium stellatum TaxID=574774 RepID=A0A8E2F9Y5_9PEZI|nr:hypothetical protein AOQ84DRAFT_385717 [Glonium stellatum]